MYQLKQNRCRLQAAVLSTAQWPDTRRDDAYHWWRRRWATSQQTRGYGAPYRWVRHLQRPHTPPRWNAQAPRSRPKASLGIDRGRDGPLPTCFPLWPLADGDWLRLLGSTRPAWHGWHYGLSKVPLQSRRGRLAYGPVLVCTSIIERMYVCIFEQYYRIHMDMATPRTTWESHICSIAHINAHQRPMSLKDMVWILHTLTSFLSRDQQFGFQNQCKWWARTYAICCGYHKNSGCDKYGWLCFSGAHVSFVHKKIHSFRAALIL